MYIYVYIYLFIYICVCTLYIERLAGNHLANLECLSAGPLPVHHPFQRRPRFGTIETFVGCWVYKGLGLQGLGRLGLGS